MLEIKNLRKNYGSICALDGVNLKLNPGEIVGLAGPNGAGKTTLFRVIAGLVGAERGEILLGGKTCTPSRLRAKVGYVPDYFGVYDNLLVREYMEFYCNANGLFGLAARQRSRQLLERMELQQLADHPVDPLSVECKQRLSIARALIGDPALLILDEPAAGMDPTMREKLRTMLPELAEEGKMVLISAHMVEDLIKLCTGVCLVWKGRILMQGSLEEVISRLAGNRPIVMTVRGSVKPAMQLLREHPLVETVTAMPPVISVGWKGRQEEIPDLLRQLVEANIPILRFGQEPGTLEDVFWKMSEKEAPEA